MLMIFAMFLIYLTLYYSQIIEPLQESIKIPKNYMKKLIGN